MAKKYVTNGDRILQAVLADEDLIRFGEYNPAEYNDLNIALYSDNLVVKTVAQIISGVNNGDNNKEIYTVVTNFLKNSPKILQKYLKVNHLYQINDILLDK